jgi:hypothetical protein
MAGCPTHPAAVKLVKHVLAAEGVEAEIHEVLVSDEAMASDLGFRGSPTIRTESMVEMSRESRGTLAVSR